MGPAPAQSPQRRWGLFVARSLIISRPRAYHLIHHTLFAARASYRLAGGSSYFMGEAGLPHGPPPSTHDAWPRLVVDARGTARVNPALGLDLVFVHRGGRRSP